jgi:origin recognition complex subunit 5
MADLSLYPEASTLLDNLSELLECAPPPFIYVHDPTTSARTGAAIRALLAGLPLRHAALDTVCCFSARLVFDSALNALARHVLVWNAGAANWGSERHNESLDAFLHGLRAVPGAGRMVLLVENAARMHAAVPELRAPLARLSELVSA